MYHYLEPYGVLNFYSDVNNQKMHKIRSWVRIWVSGAAQNIESSRKLVAMVREVVLVHDTESGTSAQWLILKESTELRGSGW